MITFQELGLKDEILQAITELGYETPMPIQEQVIPFMLNQTNDLIGLAQTGTGKTAAFGLPILNMIDESLKQIQALVLSPTRELCIQIANDVKNYASKMHNIKVVPVYGGESIVTQFRQLDVQPHILVATPGRLIDLINRGKVKLDDVRYLVLDEADEMLDMGFKEDLETILESVPDNRRTLLFSATMPNEIARIAKRYMHEATEIAIGTRNAGAENVEHIYYMVQAVNRYLALKRIVDMNPDIYGIVFCRTRQETKEVAEKLMRDGYNADALHGDLSQAQRDTVMNKFRIRNLQILVATDVAARGLDVSDLTHVINYNLPDDVEVYTHRSGRTGRANKKGVSVSIIHTRERNRIREIERMIKKEFKQMPVPNGMDICKRQLFHLIDKMEHVTVNDEQISPFMEQIFSKLQYLSKEDLLTRFVSLEFNRFLEYYKDAPDINVVEKSRENKNDREERENRGRRDRNENSSHGGKFKRGQKFRLKMSIGSLQNANPRMILGIINDTTNDKSISVGNIEITNKFTFFDIFADQVEQVLQAFEERGRLKVVVVEECSSDDRGGKRYDRKEKSEKRNNRSGKSERSHREISKRSSNSDKPWRNRR
ncbi:MAG TPA: DEAD/DEAH box helicase [Paludibacteraceae bacterium]|nr:DEAD/DEAH box helicase [Paludibacteraceae bacterium]HOO24265.1 DEAD/DEAH box helicase [Paludibacteraceae bacterium]HOS37872.1 DEAD/DEAH box helicase [Paludibacteraceae bacterium]HPK20458.1 DEAD/DEAH box helicase [Paludibacteraceae bacterium]HRU72714.1 DEAD/DEAH box helicase [Paludibacteraceae bacterium]